MSLTLRYKKFLPDWEVLGPGPSPVHALQLMSEGKTKLQSVANNVAAKNRWLTAYNAKATKRFKAIAKIWNTDYNITNIGPDTNKLLLVSNGGFMVQSAVATQSTTLVRNPRYNSGPKFTGNVKKVVFRYIGDGTAAAQALKNREIDIYQGQPTAEAVAQLKAIRTAKVIGGTNSCYEHVDLTIGALEGSTYDGLWQGYSTRSKELRTAFLLAFPRQEIISKLIKPINSKAVVLDSVFTLPGAPGYAEIAAGSGIKKYTTGTQADRTAQALALVKKYFPNTSAANPTVDVRLLWGSPTNQRRSAQSQIIKAAVAKAGFNITNNAAGDAGWGGKLGSETYDVAFFAWCPTSLSQTGTNANFESTGSNNYQGYNNPAMDTILKKFEGSLTLSQLKANYVAAEKLLVEDAATLGIFQHPQATAHNALLKNVKPAPLSPNLVWNFWQWAY
jgi:peptide/nickel transport system substrate-binding protein